MKTPFQFIASHIAVAAVIVGTMLACSSMGSTSMGAAVAVAAILSSVVAALLHSRRMQRGLALLQNMANGDDVSKQSLSGVDECDQIARDWISNSTSKEEVEANYGRLTREVGAILQRLEQTTGGNQLSATQLRSTLGNIGANLHTLLSQFQQSLAELGHCTKEIASSTSANATAVTQTRTYVDQLTDNLETAQSESKAAAQALHANSAAAQEAVQITTQLASSFGRIQSSTDANIRQIRSLCDPTRQISSMVDTIGDVAARTNMLALNASIESIRAGEHGRSFAVVADEIRKLAEQTTQATREITILTEALISQTSDSVAVISREQSNIDADAALVGTVEQQLVEIMELAAENTKRVQGLTSSHHQQRKLVDEIAGTIDRSGGTRDSDRQRSDRISWAVQSLCQSAANLDGSIRPLRRCSDNYVEDSPLDPAVSQQPTPAAKPTDKVTAIESNSVVGS